MLTHDEVFESTKGYGGDWALGTQNLYAERTLTPVPSPSEGEGG